MKLPLPDSELDALVAKVVRRTLGEDGAAAGPARKVTIGSDHRGTELKQTLIELIERQGYDVIDCGAHPGTTAADYPDIAAAVAGPVGAGEAWRGIVIDGAGIGSSIAANKIRGVRAALCYNLATAVNSREHNDANVLALGSGLTDPALAQEIVTTWLKTPFGGGRHAKRVDKIMALESQRTHGQAEGRS